MDIKYDYWDPKLELINLDETHKIIEYIIYRNEIIFHNKKIVDIGCGWGVDTMLIACGAPKSGFFQVPRSVIGIDHDLDEIKKATAFSKHLSNIQFICHDMTEQFPFDSNSVDIFLSVNALHNLKDEDKQKVFQQVGRTLRVGGYFIYIDVLFSRESEREDISSIDSFKKIWCREAFALDEKDLQTLLDIHLNPKHPFSLLLAGREEFPITVSKAKILGEKANLECINVTPIKGLVSCKRIIFAKK
jgi:ubiquinone/menaquinone biosynthesis C-methylase UbiE